MQKPPNPVAEVKPRLTKEQHDILEAEFQRHHKPSTATKKGFADHLGVPLDKINNWFQNRRAKVKQEAKKAQNAQMMQASLPFHHMQHHPVQHVGHVPQPPQPATVPEFYQMSSGFAAGPPAPTPTASASLSTDPLDVRQSIEDPLQGFSQPADYNSLFLTSIAESAGHATKDTVIQSMIKAGYGWDPVAASDVNGQAFPDDSHFGLSLDITGGAGGPLGLGASALTQAFDYNEETGPSGVSPSNSASSGPSTFSVATTAATGASTNPMSSSTNLSFNWTDNGSTDATPAHQTDNPFETDLSAFTNGSHPASSSQISLPHWMSSSYQPCMYQQSNNSSQLILPGGDSLDHSSLPGGFSDLEPPMPSFAESAYSRRSSSTSLLVENLKTVGIQNGTPTDAKNGSTTSLNAGSFSQPIPTSGLAARRQRHPAPLNAGMRSASYTSGMNGLPSPSAAVQNLAADHTLRRIRSTGVTNGRVQKSSSGSAQRSPLHFTFEQATASPKFARQVAGYSTAVSTPGLPVSTGSLAPPTPCTPSDGGRFPSWHPNGLHKPQPAATESSSPPDSLGLNWPGEPTSEDAFPVSSPPRTPLEANQLNQLRHHSVSTGSNANGAGNGHGHGPVANSNSSNANSIYRDTPPQSAPASQACFPRPIYAPGGVMASSQEFLAPATDYNSSLTRAANHIRRPSLPVSSYPVDGSMPFAVQMPTAPGDLQATYSMQFGNPMIGSFPNDAMSMFSQDSAAMSSAASVQPMAATSDFFVHQYSPPQAADQKVTASPRRQHETQIKNYVFANQGPNDFQAS